MSATLFAIATLMTSGVYREQPPADIERLLTSVEAAYACGSAYQLDIVEHTWRGGADGPTAAEAAALGPEDVIRHVRIKVHPKLGRVFDFTHPLQRIDDRRISGFVESSGARYRIEPQGERAERTAMSDERMAASCARLVPTCLPVWMRRLAAAEGATASVVAEGATIRTLFPTQGTAFVVDARDFTVLEFSETRGGATTSTRFLGFRSTSLASARFPSSAMQIFDGMPAGETEAIHTQLLRTFTLSEVASISDEDFSWWKYAPTAADTETHDEYGPGNVLRTSGESASEMTNAATGAAPKMKLSEQSVRENALDAGRRVLPRERSTLGTFLSVAGISALVLALACWVRGRVAAR